MKKRLIVNLFIALLMVTFCSVLMAEINIHDTILLSQPAISKDHIAFVYAGDLWMANSDGSGVRRLTTDEGVESNPVFSPDGKWIAFSAQYDGNTDVYIIPAEGGIPKRLTWHPGADIVRGFTVDGSAVLFISRRFVFTNRYFQLVVYSLYRRRISRSPRDSSCV